MMDKHVATDGIILPASIFVKMNVEEIAWLIGHWLGTVISQL